MPKGFTEQFYQLVDESLAQSATKQEVKETIETFIGLLRDLQRTLETKLEEKHSMMYGEHTRLGGTVKEIEQSLRATIDEKISGTEKAIDIKLNELSALIGYVESMIEKYDDAEIRGHIQQMNDFVKGMEAKMPTEFDPKEIVEDIEELEKKYDELDKKLIRIGQNTSGGVSNLRIQQAFKYILKTEQPVGDIDGVNLSYTVSQPIFAVLGLSINGETIAQLPNYTISGKTITFSEALPAVYSGKDFELKYV
jgi:hypothetical protein